MQGTKGFRDSPVEVVVQIRHASEDVKLAVRYMNLEFREEIQVGHVHL